MGELIAVLSGKGGTGKTSVCAGLATALAKEQERVLCIDCDVGLRNLDIALGLSDFAALSFTDVYDGSYKLENATVHPDFPTLHFLTAPVGCSSNAVDQELFADLLNGARKCYNYIFLDAPAGIETGFTLAARYADRVILVTGADPASVRDAHRASQVLEQMGKQNVRLIVNRINEDIAAAMKITVDDVMDQSGLPLLGIIPDDPHVVLAAAFKKPLLRQTKKGAAAACRRIARRIQGLREPVKLK